MNCELKEVAEVQAATVNPEWALGAGQQAGVVRGGMRQFEIDPCENERSPWRFRIEAEDEQHAATLAARKIVTWCDECVASGGAYFVERDASEAGTSGSWQVWMRFPRTGPRFRGGSVFTVKDLGMAMEGGTDGS